MGCKHEDHEEHGGAWEIALADLMTTLMVFFLVMWLISIVDPAERASFVKGLQEGAMADEGELEPFQLDMLRPRPHVATKEDVTIDEVYEAMSNIKRKDLEVERTPDGLKITLHSDSFFESGRATINEETAIELEKLGETLAGRTQPIKITGYTDSIPIETLQFPSNWELSAARAATVARTFIYMGLESKWLTIEGKADNEPVAPNDTPYGRSLNRRVVILVKDSGLLDESKVASPTQAQPLNRPQQMMRPPSQPLSNGVPRQPYNRPANPNVNQTYNSNYNATYNQTPRFNPNSNFNLNTSRSVQPAYQQPRTYVPPRTPATAPAQ